MTTVPMHADLSPTVRVTERSDGHFLPFVIGIALAVGSTVVSILMTGLPQ